jgi:hypothetical protein
LSSLAAGFSELQAQLRQECRSADRCFQLKRHWLLLYLGEITPIVAFQWPSSYGAYTDTENIIYAGKDGNLYQLYSGRGESAAAIYQ